MHQHDEQLLQAEQELSAQRVDLEAREGNLAEALGKLNREVATHKKHVERFNARFAERKEEAEKEFQDREKAYRAAVSRDYNEKFLKQEGRFRKRRDEDDARIRELELMNARLNSRARRAADGRRLAEEARERMSQDLAALMADMEEMNKQVGPAVERAVEAAESAQAARVLSQQRERMFLSLVVRGNDLAAKLGVEAPHVPAQGNADAAAYLAYFDQLFTTLEGPAAEIRDVVEEECRQLLAVAVDRIFSNLQRLQPGFDYTTVTDLSRGEEGWKISNSIRDQVDDFCSRFKRAEAKEDDGEEASSVGEPGEERSTEEGDEASA